MTINSMTFLLVFLPISLFIYYISNDRIKEYVLLGISLLFYALGSIQFLVGMLLVMCITVFIGRMINSMSTGIVKVSVLALGIIINVGILGYYKYYNFIIDNVNCLLGTHLNYRQLLMPLGISFFTFKAISYLVDIYCDRACLDNNPAHDLLYLSFFSQIQSGPISRYGEMIPRVELSKNEKVAMFSEGVYRFLIGFSKKILIANVLVNITKEVFSQSFDNFSMMYAWLGAISFSLQLYFDFAGYSDMAIGLTQMFGYSCKENFEYPYMTKSVGMFWRKWHISLGQWFRDYVYIPLGGSRSKSKIRVCFNLLVVWVLTGIWHGAAWNYVIWGLGYFVVISFEKMTGYPDKIKSKLIKGLYRIATLVFIIFQWVIFRANNLTYGLKYIKRMVIYNSNPLADKRTMFLIKDYAFFLIIAILLCFPVVPWLDEKLEKNKYIHTVYEVIIGVLVVLGYVWAISYVVSGQNNPFAYANF